MNWRIKVVVAAWLIAAIAVAILVRNLMLGEWRDLPFVSRLLFPVFLLLFGSYFLVREARRNLK